ncbi:MAG TPA: hypothetical protein VK674_01945 [Candidatus Limnocylindria bacterium]|nr:hypothetical protein [Candidatus Limnocylindria bacterium]
MRFRSDQVITLEQAKILLGDEALTMTDEEIQKMIVDFDLIAQYAIKEVQKFKKKDSETD